MDTPMKKTLTLLKPIYIGLNDIMLFMTEAIYMCIHYYPEMDTPLKKTATITTLHCTIFIYIYFM